MIGHRFLNLTYIRNLSGNNNQFVVRMLQTFCKNIPEGVDSLQVAASSGNFDEMKQIAHKLKTMFRYVGVDEVAEYLERLELSANELSETERNHMLTHIDTASKRALAEARDVILTTPI